MQEQDPNAPAPPAPPAAVRPVTVQIAGLARGNPGLAGAGIVILAPDGTPQTRVARYLGNVAALDAQLQALELGLRYARPHIPSPLRLVLGNETIVRQLAGQQPARHPSVLRMTETLYGLLDAFGPSTFVLGKAGEMEEAERLANLGIDMRLRPFPAYDRPLPT